MYIRLSALLVFFVLVLSACQEEACQGGETPDPDGNCPIEDEQEATP
ncbi:MAG: hypothetical protein ACKO6N_20565 [Myxococcota bacterium]